jgi:SAM-dependent methyltransferase
MVKKQPTKENTGPIYPVSGLADQTVSRFRFLLYQVGPQTSRRTAGTESGRQVIDAGCGSGGSFPFLVAEIGDAGEVVGIEISPESTASAWKRITKNGWSNVSVLEAPAEDAVLTGTFDGLLMFAAPDVFASEIAWKNLTPYLTGNARVAFFEAKLTHHWLGAVLNPVLRMMSKLSFSTTPGPDYEPWAIAKRTVEEIKVNEYFFGLMFLASGRLIK